jgi:hypothetical protein
MSPAALPVLVLNYSFAFLLCRRPETGRISDRLDALDPSHDPRNPENDEAAPAARQVER